MQKFVLSVLVENHAGVLSRVSGLFSRRGYNIDSLTVCETSDKAVSRMTIVVMGDERILDQIEKQLSKLVEVISIERCDAETCQRETALIKVKADGSKREIYDNGLRDFFGGDVKKAVTRFWEQSFEMIETERFDIIAHFDKIKMHNQKRYFTEEEDWYLRLVDHCIELIRRKQLIVEINTRGIYKGRCPDYYPSDYALAQIAKYNIPMVVSTDAHKSEELSEGRDAAVEHLKSMGIKFLMYRKNNQWEEYAIV